MKQMIGMTLVMLGVIVMAGSAGDCDGRCMDQANDLVTMLMLAGAGMITVIFGTSLVVAK